MLLDRRRFLVKERVAVLKLTDTYDILETETGTAIGIARDEPGTFTKLLRLVVEKRLLPTKLNIYELNGTAPVISLQKKPGLLRITVQVRDADGSLLGSFRSKLFTLGGGFVIMDATGAKVAEVKGDWKGFNFRVLDSNGEELGVVSKKWGGIAKEFFTSADSYVISMSDTQAAANVSSAIALAAGLAIDVVFKE